MDIYQNRSYKTLIQDQIHKRKKILGSQYSFQGAATAAGIQKTYLSKVFSDHKTHLSDDQLFEILNYLELKPDEKRYTELLHGFERSHNPGRKTLIKQEIEQLRREKLSTHTHIKTQDLIKNSPERASEYYTDPNLQLLHMLLTIPELTKQHEHLGSIIGVSTDDIQGMTKRLIDLGLVEFSEGHIRVNKLQLHLKDNSHVIRPYRKLLRLKALEKPPHKNDYSFSVVFSCDEKTRRQVNQILLTAVTQIKKLVDRAKPEQVHQINIDLLGWHD